jgi:predicted small lipoprotein YifL
MRNMSKKVIVIAGLCLSLAACSGKGTTPTTTTPTSTTSTTTSTTTTTTTTTIPVAPEISAPAQTIPVIKTEGRKTAGPCVDVGEVDYCVWGTRPVDKTITNSRSVEFTSVIEQGFTSMSDSMNSIQMEFESRVIGKFIAATEATDPNAICMQVSIASSQGLPLSTMAYTDKDGTGVRQRITMPVVNALIPGTGHSLKIQKGPACTSHDLAVMVAMSSQYKYPSKYGTLTIDGRKSSGSLWALID